MVVIWGGKDRRKNVGDCTEDPTSGMVQEELFKFTKMVDWFARIFRDVVT